MINIETLGTAYAFCLVLLLFVSGISTIGLAQINMPPCRARRWLKAIGTIAALLGAAIFNQMCSSGVLY